MNTPVAPVEIALRIPGRWSHPQELIQAMPTDVRLTAEGLLLPDNTRIEFGALDADNQFAEIFRSSCRRPATDDELTTVDGYTVNVVLCGPGGSMEAARTMMQAGSAVVRAGGAGVFIDNSAVAHGGQTWLELTADGGPDAVSFAFVAIVRGKADVWTMGMHVLGLRNVVMKRADVESDRLRYRRGDPLLVPRRAADRRRPRDRQPGWTPFSGVRGREHETAAGQSHA